MEDFCQPIASNIEEELLSFNEQVSKAIKSGPVQLTLRENISQLGALVALVNVKKRSHVIIHKGSKQAALEFTTLANSWSSLLNVNSSWHIFSDQLSEQEIDGTVISSLSQTFHHFLSAQTNQHFVIPEAAIDQIIPDPKVYAPGTIKINTAAKMELHTLTKALVDLGYTRYESSLEPGGFRIRGEQLDIQPINNHATYTITLYGSVIESIVKREQRQTNVEHTLALRPVKLPSPSIPLLESLTDRVIFRPQHLSDIKGHSTIIYDALTSDYQFPWQPIANRDNPSNKFAYIFIENRERVEQYLKSGQITNYHLCDSPLAKHRINLESRTHRILSEADLLPPVSVAKPISYQKGLTLVADLTLSKPAVHSDHGIGIYEGLQTRTINDQTREYLILRYAALDTLSVPVEYAYKVTAYLGQTTPPLHRLSNSTWTKHKKKATIDAAKFAKELLTIAGQRASTKRQPFIIDPELEQSLANSFPFDLTADQQTVWHDIQQDLTRDIPMDRLVVGDVGFGKTELAVRAAAHVAATGGQVAVLAPTTLLVQQHIDTFSHRLKDFDFNIDSLSRFLSSTQQALTRQKIEHGETNIVIGTHALLSQKTRWHNLGLVIIDEEQRFGVKHKEHFKTMRANIDLLSLSATPIPRTLSMALSGLKQLSILSTAPVGRKAIISTISKDRDSTLKAAIMQELSRQGQIYVVSPNIRGLGAIAHRITTQLPEARVAVAHGQLPPHDLAQIMHQFDTGQLDVLVSSTIIASGIDLPNANTIVVIQATHFGLADLYQLRGRVGRRARQGYAFFLYNQGKLNPVQRKRLTALTEATRLGSGWSLAQRDLEIRGAGNILGADQSGSVNAIGAQLYLDLVHDAIDANDQIGLDRRDVDIQLPLNATIPNTYIADINIRTKVYQQLARAANIDDLKEQHDSLITRYGQPPPEVINLLLLLRLQHLAAGANITSITSQPITPPGEDPYIRLSITTTDIASVSQKIDNMGNWRVKDDTLFREVNVISPALVFKLIDCLGPVKR